MSGGKGGSTSTKIPSWVRDPAERNLARAEEASRIGYVPFYGPSVAAFSPLQRQGFANLGAAGQAFGLAPEGEMFQPTMRPTDYGGGLEAYSSGPLYDLALAELEARRPGQFGAINNMFVDPVTGQFNGATPAPAAPGVPPMAGQPSHSDGPMWSDGMTGAEIRAHQEARTFGASAPLTPQQAYDAQMAQYERSNPGISVSEVRGAPISGGGFLGGLLSQFR